MAFPTIRASANGAISTAAKAVTITLPTGHSMGDLLIIGLSLDGSRTVAAPAGWNLLANPTNTTANRFPIWWKPRAATESNPQLTWISTSEKGTWFSIAITAGTWFGIPEIATVYGSSSAPNAPSLSPSWGAVDTLWFALYGWDYNRTSSSALSGWSLLTYQPGSATDAAGHRTYSRAVAGTQDPAAITISAIDTWYAHTVAIKGGPIGIGGKIGTTWKQAESIFVNIDGVWRQGIEVYQNINGTWRSTAGGNILPDTTAAPTVGSPVCWDDFGYKYLNAYITNNDTSGTATIRRDGATIGTLGPTASSDMTLNSGFSTPFYYDYFITAQVSGEEESNAVRTTGTVNICYTL